jgi:hypothetical protein
MYRLFGQGTRVQWKTVDGHIHIGTVQKILREGKHSVLEDGQTDPVIIMSEGCTEYKEKKK